MSNEELTALMAFATAMSFTPGPNTTPSATLAANFGLRWALGFIVATAVWMAGPMSRGVAPKPVLSPVEGANSAARSAEDAQ